MKKGFTLIELLAVIVILAVLALIATPIVLNIIDDSKKNATLRSSENYIKAIEFSIAKSVMENKRLNDGTYPIMSSGNICLGTLTNSTCDNELIVEVSGETPESGTVTIKSRKIDSYEFTYASGFVVINGEINSEGEDSNLTLAQFILKQAQDNNYYYTITPDFSKAPVDGEYGLYQAPDDLGTSYYFRGDTENNYVQFGTFTNDILVYEGEGGYDTYFTLEECEEEYGDACDEVILSKSGELITWRIIRINGDGTIRMIYSRQKAHNGTTYYFPDIGKTLYYDVGDLYGSGEHLQYAQENPKKESTIKSFIDNWYDSTLKTNYGKYIADSIFCNDREVTKYVYFDEGYEEINDSADAYYTAEYYGSYTRLVENKKPKLTCTRNIDKYTINTDIGNGLLTNPIALITADEVVMAGGNIISAEDYSYSYLYTDTDYWTISPHSDNGYDNASMFSVTEGELFESSLSGITEDMNYVTARPVINLKADVKFTGDGSYDNPYVIVTD